MRGLDTNVLVRLITRDEPDQALAVLLLLEEAEARNERFFVSTIVVCEVAWTLRSRPYKFDRSEIAEALALMLETDLFLVQDANLTRQAVDEYREGPADFSDYLIGGQNRTAGCGETITFDRELASIEGYSLLA